MDDYPHLNPFQGPEKDGLPMSSMALLVYRRSHLHFPRLECHADKDHRQMTWNMDVSENSIPPQLWPFSSNFEGERVMISGSKAYFLSDPSSPGNWGPFWLDLSVVIYI